MTTIYPSHNRSPKASRRLRHAMYHLGTIGNGVYRVKILGERGTGRVKVEGVVPDRPKTRTERRAERRAAELARLEAGQNATVMSIDWSRPRPVDVPVESAPARIPGSERRRMAREMRRAGRKI